MPSSRAYIHFETSNPMSTLFLGAGTNYIIETPTGVLYIVYVDVNSDVVFRKSTNKGLTWSLPTVVFTGTVTNLSVWYDRWSNIAAGLIHCAYTESVTDDTLYRTINTESSDALSTQTSIFAGASTLAGGCLSICRARGGNVYCATMIDAGTEGGFFRLPNANVPNGAWDAARATVFEAATSDQVILMPGWAADNQDMMAFFWDASADEISRKLYDDSANSWAEASIATGMVDQAASVTFPSFSGVVDITNSRNLLLAWSAVDAANADLRMWRVTESSISEQTNVVLNSTDDQGMCALALDTTTGRLYAIYCGKSDGSETYGTTVNVYYKVSTDGGSTWGPETAATATALDLYGLMVTPRFLNQFLFLTMVDAPTDEAMISVAIALPKAQFMLGM